MRSPSPVQRIGGAMRQQADPVYTLDSVPQSAERPRSNRRQRRYRPSIDGLEQRQLLAGGVADRHAFAPTPSEYYPQPVPIAPPVGLNSSSPIWADATTYQYGPDPREQLWVLVPPNPSGKLDLIVHSGGFHQG